MDCESWCDKLYDTGRKRGPWIPQWNCCGINFKGVMYDGPPQVFSFHLKSKPLEDHIHGLKEYDWLALAGPVKPAVVNSCCFTVCCETDANIDDEVSNFVVASKVKVNFLNADEVEADEVLFPAGVVIPSFSLTPALSTVDIASEVLRDGSCRLPAETRLGKFKTPSRSDAFKEPIRWGFLPSSIQKTPSSTNVSGNNAEHSVLLVAPNSREVVDNRVSSRYRERVAEKKPCSVHVGPVAINLVNYGSSASDLCQAGVFLDSRHGSSENATLGAYVTRVNNEEQALLFFPGSKLPLTPQINDVLKVRFGISNLDMDGIYQLFESTAIVQTWENVQGNKPTLLTTKGEQDDMLMAQKFARNHCQVTGVVRDRYVPRDTQVSLGKSFSLRQVDGGDFHVCSAPRRSVLIKANLDGSTSSCSNVHPNFANALQEGVNFPVNLVDLDDDTNNILSTEVVEVPLSATHGSNLGIFTLNHLLRNGNGKARLRLQTCVSTNCCIRVEIEGGQCPFVGGGICGAFAEGTNTWTAGFVQAFGVDNFVMNPFRDERIVYHFRPVPHSRYWNPIQLVDMPASFALFFLGPYTNPPKQAVAVTVRFFIAPCSDLGAVAPNSLDVVDRTFGGYIGCANFKQAEKGIVKKFPLFLGHPVLVKGRRVYSQMHAILSNYAAIQGEVEIECFVYSSTFINGAVHVGLVASVGVGGLNINVVQRLPSVKTILKHGSNILRFPIGNSSGLCPTTGKDLVWADTMESSLVLVMWTSGGVSSTIDGDFTVVAAVKRVFITDRMGNGLVHMHKILYKNNSAMNWRVPVNWFNVFTWNFETAMNKPYTCDLELYNIYQSVVEQTVAGDSLVRSIPPALAVLGTSTFSRAVMHVKICWWKWADVEYGKSTHIVCASLFPNGVDASSTDHLMSSEPTGYFEFSYEVTGPFDGLRFVGGNLSIAGQSGKPVLKISIDGPKTCRMLALSAKVENLYFTGPSNGWSFSSTDIKENTCDF